MLDQAKFIVIGLGSKDSTSTIAAQRVRKGSNSLLGLLTETWTKR